MLKKQLFLFSIAVFCCGTLVYAIQKRPNLHDQLFVKPTDWVVTLLTGIGSEHLPDQGYYRVAFHATIDRTCSGINLWTMAFLLFAWLFAGLALDALLYIGYLSVAVLASWVFAMGANSSGISLYLHMKHLIPMQIPSQTAHVAIGLITHLGFLIILYLLIIRLFKK